MIQKGVNIACSWSGGKDSCFSLMQAIKSGAVLKVVLNMMNENGKISRSHGLSTEILRQQAAAMNVPLFTRPSTWDDYEMNFVDAIVELKSRFFIEAVVFGDIDLPPHREWEEKVCGKGGVEALLPIWQRDRKELVMNMLNEKLVAMIVSCNEVLGERFLGRILDAGLVHELEAMGVDVCGENGEFHTVVIDCPLFGAPIQIPPHRKECHKGYHFLCWEE
jgi:diphthine-ammonia ligase